MELINTFATLISLCALFSYLNHRYLHLPTTIGVMIISLSISLLLIGFNSVGITLTDSAAQALQSLNFNQTLMRGMLGFLLFAGALHVDINQLAEKKFSVGILATAGVVMCTLLVGGAGFLLFNAIGLEIALLQCMLFGALISPTDPIAVLSILKQVSAPQSLETKIAGESLFNDGIGVVVFLILLQASIGGQPITLTFVIGLLLLEAVGGIAFGWAIGYLAYLMLKSVDNYQVEVLITLALVMGGYALADLLHTSGPLTMVVAGLMIGNRGRALAMSDRTREHLDTFWELLDEILNVLLFVLIGFELLVLALNLSYLLAGLIAIPLVLFSRLISVGIPLSILRLSKRGIGVSPHAVKVMTWGGLRGGISIALALSLPASPERDALLVITYLVVAFSIVCQGLTMGPLLKKLYRSEFSMR